jgi:hypothetical protein
MNDEAAPKGRFDRATSPPESVVDAAASARMWRAMMLAPTLEVWESLLRGELVPAKRLDPDWVKRFGIRQ